MFKLNSGVRNVAVHERALGVPVGWAGTVVPYNPLAAFNITVTSNPLTTFNVMGTSSASTAVTLTGVSAFSAGALNALQGGGTLTNTIYPTVIEGQLQNVSSAVAVFIDYTGKVLAKEETANYLHQYLLTRDAWAALLSNAASSVEPSEQPSQSWDAAAVTAFSNVAGIASNRPNVDLFGRVMDYVRRFSKTGYGPQIANRLQQLKESSEEDDDGGVLSSSSVWSLTAFIEKQQLKRPTLSTTPSGDVVAQWRGGNAMLSVMFLPDGKVKYFSTSPNPNHPEMRDRQTGSTTWDALYEAAHLGALDWTHR